MAFAILNRSRQNLCSLKYTGTRVFVCPFFTFVRKVAFRLSGHNQYGLLWDDLLREDDPDIVEALRRLPLPLKDERVYRQIRAMQLSLMHTVLPKDKWTKYEEDIRYLKPYLDEVIRERQEITKWKHDH